VKERKIYTNEKLSLEIIYPDNLTYQIENLTFAEQSFLAKYGAQYFTNEFGDTCVLRNVNSYFYSL